MTQTKPLTFLMYVAVELSHPPFHSLQICLWLDSLMPAITVHSLNIEWKQTVLIQALWSQDRGRCDHWQPPPPLQIVSLKFCNRLPSYHSSKSTIPMNSFIWAVRPGILWQFNAESWLVGLHPDTTSSCCCSTSSLKVCAEYCEADVWMKNSMQAHSLQNVLPVKSRYVT